MRLEFELRDGTTIVVHERELETAALNSEITHEYRHVEVLGEREVISGVRCGLDRFDNVISLQLLVSDHD